MAGLVDITWVEVNSHSQHVTNHVRLNLRLQHQFGINLTKRIDHPDYQLKLSNRKAVQAVYIPGSACPKVEQQPLLCCLWLPQSAANLDTFVL